MKIVFNSSPLIFLARLNFLDKFIDGTAEFYCPEWVREEINDKSDVASQSINRLIESNRIISQPTNLFSLANRLNSRLGKGESQGISLGIEIQTDYIILDDFAARKEALRLGLTALRARQKAGGRRQEGRFLVKVKPFCLAQLGLSPPPKSSRGVVFD